MRRATQPSSFGDYINNNADRIEEVVQDHLTRLRYLTIFCWCHLAIVIVLYCYSAKAGKTIEMPFEPCSFTIL